MNTANVPLMRGKEQEQDVMPTRCATMLWDVEDVVEMSVLYEHGATHVLNLSRLLCSRRSQARRRKREQEAAQDDADRNREHAEVAAKKQKAARGEKALP